jgi:hypothetical protein
MPGISAPNTFGNMMPANASGLNVVDHANLTGLGKGTFQPVKKGWVWDPSTQTFMPFWPLLPVFTGAAITWDADWRFATFSWNAPTAETFDVYTNNVLRLDGTVEKSYRFNWFSQGVPPNSTFPVKVIATNATGDTTLDMGDTVKAPAVPAPAGVTATDRTQDSVTISWSAVPGATSYRILDVNNNYELVQATNLASVTITGLTPSTAHSWCVVTVADNPDGIVYRSDRTAVVTFNTRAWGLTPGVYEIQPAGNATWQRGLVGGQAAGWRPTTDPLFHGDENGDNRETQTSFFFYGTRFTTRFPDGLGSATVTKVEVYLARGSDVGNSGKVLSHWMQHPFTSNPGTNPMDNTTPGIDAGDLAWGEAAWIELPVAWGANLINQEVGKAGIAWGDTDFRYMRASSNLSLAIPNGTLRITVA